MATYWHELSKEEQEKIRKSGIKPARFLIEYKQPPWCCYPGALEGRWGCHLLITGKIHSEEDCKLCPCYIENIKSTQKECPFCNQIMKLYETVSFMLKIGWCCPKCNHFELIFPLGQEEEKKKVLERFCEKCEEKWRKLTIEQEEE
ncbi:MAG: hypothetical protein DRO05_00525 [Thermoproteota archaeon]|nr:MAG: hypothetical protein DRO05_00525 [Candidatus Korarchaeota archaeon]